MPNRLGLLHVRDKCPESEVLSQADIDNALQERENKLKCLMEKPAELQHEEAVKLGTYYRYLLDSFSCIWYLNWTPGLKTEADEVEKFVASNCQEVNKDKWLCPLSGKKFKAPEFIRKHILNKFADQVEKVKQETQFYNNYLRDPKRPELPERPPVPKPTPTAALNPTIESDGNAPF